MEREYFSFDEAQAKVGHRIKTLVEFSGVPKDTTGRVIRFDRVGPAFVLLFGRRDVEEFLPKYQTFQGSSAL